MYPLNELFIILSSLPNLCASNDIANVTYLSLWRHGRVENKNNKKKYVKLHEMMIQWQDGDWSRPWCGVYS
jgi:hypothetical protein